MHHVINNLLISIPLLVVWVKYVANPIHAIFLFPYAILSVYGNLVADGLCYLTV